MSAIAFSNLAWQAKDDKKVYQLMKDLNVYNLEISPFRSSSDISSISPNAAKTLKKDLKKYSINIVALQAVLFRFPELVIFKDKLTREKTFKHMVKVINFAHAAGAQTVVFGSPKNKLRGGMKYDKALSIAVDFFGRLANVSEAQGGIIVIEPTPEIYGADFIRNTQEAIKLISHVNKKALKLNFDIGSAVVNNENIKDEFMNNIEHIGHVHISEPYLKALNLHPSFHNRISKIINLSPYNGLISIEMLPQPKHNLDIISDTLSFIKTTYKL